MKGEHKKPIGQSAPTSFLGVAQTGSPGVQSAPPDAASQEFFRGTPRFEVRRRLGSGGFGVVYEAFDRDYAASIALKTLLKTRVNDLYRFKLEFRALAHIVHRNLVTLYELLSEGEHWFFTMELIDGVSFLEHVRPPIRTERAALSTVSLGDAALETVGLTVGDTHLEVSDPASRRQADHLRLGEALRQLAAGVSALHDAGKLHCDLKPSNVLIGLDGRVVILDFGLVANLGAQESSANSSGAGTPSYMSPEQAAGLPLSEASDWYSFGVMLYEALTGRLPFVGPSRKVLEDKQRFEPIPAAELAPGIPNKWNELCFALLRRDPLMRPSRAEIMDQLGVRGAPQISAGPTPGVTLVGRERQLGILEDAFRAAKQGRMTTVCVHGEPGIGKSALVRKFLGAISQHHDCVVLEGRCYERESVPYKALDSLIDNLRRFLRSREIAELRRLLPPDFSVLTRIFPVLQGAASAAGLLPNVGDIPDARELRRRAFAALGNLLAAIASRNSLVLFIDDVQWGDIDSAAFLADLVRPVAPFPALLILCYRTEEAQTSPLLRKLFPHPAGEGANPAIIDLPLRELEAGEAQELAAALLASKPQIASTHAAQIASESKGNPFFIGELAKYVEARARPGLQGRRLRDDSEGVAGASVEELALDHVIRLRFSELPAPTCRLLEVIAVAGHPIGLSVARAAAGLERGLHGELARLRADRLVRTRVMEYGEEIETYHDSIRRTMEGRLTPDALAGHHGRLAMELESSGRADARALAIHFRGAGIPEKAFYYAVAAADQASQALAFDNASQFYRLALDIDRARARNLGLRAKLGEMLSNAGRGAEGAEAYLAASQEAAGVDKLELQRRAAGQFMMSGRIDQGLATAGDVLAAIGLKMPPSPRRALISFFALRAILIFRGLRFRERSAAEIAPSELLRIDVCFSLIQGLGMVDTIRAHSFHAREMLLALRAGEPYRVCRSLCVEAAYYGLAGGRHRRKIEELLGAADALAERIGHPHALGLTALLHGMSAFMQGQWKSAAAGMERAESILRQHCTGVAWEIATSHMMGNVALSFLGEIRDLSERLPRILTEADRRGDLYEVTDLRTRLGHLLGLAADKPQVAHRELDEALKQWVREDFDLQHWWALIGRIEVFLYEGDGAAAWEKITTEWRALRRSLLMRVQYVRLETLHHRARAALACASLANTMPSERSRLLKLASLDAKRMANENMPWSNPLAAVIRAGVAATRGDQGRAAELLLSSEAGFRAADMNLYASAAQRLRGKLLGGEPGRQLVTTADEWMASRAIHSPERFAAMLVPGFG